MVYAALMAGGSGTRMGGGSVPKQFLSLGGRPIIVTTAEKFLTHPGVDRLAVMCPAEWVAKTQALLEEYFPDCRGRIITAPGGASRSETLRLSVELIKSRFNAGDDDIILTHDAVRPFVTGRIIGENIAAAREHGACNTMIPATDTIAGSRDGRFVDTTYDRSTIFHCQTPQSFRLGDLAAVLDAFAECDGEKLTDACMMFTLSSRPVYIVRGEQTNIKITWPGDLAIAEAILKNENK